MKNKIFKYIFVLASVATTLTACHDGGLFRDTPNDKLSDETIWKSPQLLDEYVLSWYRNCDSGFYTYVTTIMAGLGTEYEPWYGDQLTVGKSSWYQGDYGDILKSSQQRITKRGLKVWTTAYNEIASINRLLEHEGAIADGPQKTRLLGEAHFFRAFYYFKLLRMFGGPLLIDHTWNPLKGNVKFPRASYEQTVKFITDEAEQAFHLLEKVNTPDNIGRPTQGAALMLKAKAFQWAAGVKFQNAEKEYLGFPDNRTDAMLDAAYAEYLRIQELNVYNLIQIKGTARDQVVQEYRDIFLTKNSEESIFEIQHDNTGNFSNANGHKLDRDAAAPYFGGTIAAFNPTQNHVDEYRMANGKRINEGGSDYDKNNPYEGRDYRFYANVLYDGAMWNSHEMDIHYTTVNGEQVKGVDLTIYGSSTTAAVTKTGYYMAKFLKESQSINTDDTYASSQNCILWRYAELLLDMAEIEFLRGRTGDALDKVNQIRRRVKMPELQSLTWDDIMNERRVELAFEKSTYWDILRYGKAETVMTGTTNPLFGVKIVYNASGNKTITNPVVNGRNTVVRYFRERQYFYPIAWDDVRYHGIDQNPEWVEM